MQLQWNPSTGVRIGGLTRLSTDTLLQDFRFDTCRNLDQWEHFSSESLTLRESYC